MSTVVPDVPKGFELIEGVLKQNMTSVKSSWIGGRIFRLIANHSHEAQLGWTFGAETGCQCFEGSPTTVLKTKVTFIKAGRMGWDQIGDGWLRVVPNLIVEVISPNHTAYEIDRKIEMFLKAGVPLIWVVYPNVRTVRIIRGNGSTATLREGDSLSGEDVLPGFHCPLASIFPPVVVDDDAAKV